MDKETINTLFEGIISLAVIVGAGLMVSTHSENTAVIGLASGAGMAVITFWFGSRAVTKAVNGNITALSNIAGQVSTSREQAAQTAAATAIRVVAAGVANHPPEVPHE